MMSDRYLCEQALILLPSWDARALQLPEVRLSFPSWVQEQSFLTKGADGTFVFDLHNKNVIINGRVPEWLTGET